MTDWTNAETFRNALNRAETIEKGHYFEDFEEGQTLEHAPGLTLSAHANELWMSQTLNHDPTYWRSDAAQAVGYEDCPVHPDYLLASVMGPTVEDLSEKGGYFLGRDDVVVHDPAVTPGTEIRVESTVEAKRESSSRPNYGIVTWETTGYAASTGDPLLSYSRTNMIPRREPMATDGGGGTTGNESTADPDLPSEFVAPNDFYFEDFRDAHERTTDRDATVAYRHERGRTMDDVLVSALPLATLNTAKQHHDDHHMADSPSGEIVAYGDVTRSIALGHARSDERTYREVGYSDERFHDFVTTGDTIYGFTRLLDAEDTGHPDAGEVTFEHFAVNQRDEPVYSGTRTALIRKRT